MMYTHTVTAYRRRRQRSRRRSRTRSTSTRSASPATDGMSQGAPVETAFTSDGRYAYVSNYSMYGNGFGPEGSDKCSPSSGYDNSFVYRIDTQTFQIDQVIAVGAVPKYVAVTPDDSKVLVTNWCTYDLSIIDTASAKRGRAAADRPVPPRHRRGSGRRDGVRRGHGRQRGDARRPRPRTPSANWRRRVTGHVTSRSRPTVLRSTSRTTDRARCRASISRPARSPRTSLDGLATAQHGHLGRRHRAVRRELRVVDRHQAAGRRPRRARHATDRSSPDRRSRTSRRPGRFGWPVTAVPSSSSTTMRPPSDATPIGKRAMMTAVNEEIAR